MGNRILYVGGLSNTISDEQLHELVGAHGTVVSAHVIRFPHSGRSAGYGFVEMGSAEQARMAVRALEGTHFAGQCLRLYVTAHPTAASPSSPTDHS